MVKVKEMYDEKYKTWELGFNHPMVKVKVRRINRRVARDSGFNHPMVKVKVFGDKKGEQYTSVSTTLW